MIWELIFLGEENMPFMKEVLNHNIPLWDKCSNLPETEQKNLSSIFEKASMLELAF